MLCHVLNYLSAIIGWAIMSFFSGMLNFGFDVFFDVLQSFELNTSNKIFKMTKPESIYIQIINRCSYLLVE